MADSKFPNIPNYDVADALERLRRSIPPNSNTANLLEKYIDLLPDEAKPVELDDDQTRVIRLMSLDVQQTYHDTRKYIDDIELVVAVFGSKHRRLNTMAPLVPKNHPDRTKILETLEDFRPEDFASLTEEMEAFQDEITDFADKTFGAAGDPLPPLHHLRQEVKELIASPYDALEYADAFILLIQSAKRANLSMTQLLAAAKRKHQINLKRKWGKPDANGVVNHIK